MLCLVAGACQSEKVAEKPPATKPSEVKNPQPAPEPKPAAPRAEVLQRMEFLRGRLREDPDNVEAREELILLHLLEMDDSLKARSLLKEEVDGILRRNIPITARAISKLGETDSLAMGQWYVELLTSAASPVSGAVVYRRIRDYYNRFLALHPQNDLDRLKAKLAVDSAELQLDTTYKNVSLPKRRTLGP
jgi:hypothetical protein